MKQTPEFLSSSRFLLIAGCFLIASFTWAQVGPPASPKAQTWVASWGASQQIPEPQNALPPDDLRDATMRQIFHLSVGGPAVRVHLSNAFGTEALHFTAVHIARPLSPSSPAIDVATDRPLTFAGSTDVTVPPGAEFVSDPIESAVAPRSDLAVTFHLDLPPARETGHPGSRATSYYLHGDSVTYDAEGRVARTARFKEGLLDGEVITYDAAGRVRERCQFLGGIPHGELTLHDERGWLVQRMSYLAGKPEGECVIFSDGRPAAFLHYRQGVPEGERDTVLNALHQLVAGGAPALD